MFHSTVHLLWNFPAFCRHSPKDSRFIQSTENCQLTDSQISFFGPHKGSFWCVVYITGLVLEIRHCFPTIENPFKWIHVCETIKQIFLRHAIELWPMAIFSFNQNFGQKTVIIKKMFFRVPGMAKFAVYRAYNILLLLTHMRSGMPSCERSCNVGDASWS